MLTWWDGSHWTDRRTPIPGGPLDPDAIIRPVTDEGTPPGLPGDDDDRPGLNSGPIPVIGGAPDDSNDAVFADPTSVFAPIGGATFGAAGFGGADADPDGDGDGDGDAIDAAFDPRADDPRPFDPRDDEPGRPRLLLVLVPLFLIALAAAALILTTDSSDDGETADEDTEELTTIGEAVEVAEAAGLPIDLPESTIASLIEEICAASGRDGAEAPLSTRIAQLPISVTQVNALLNALGKGAATRCPDDIAADSGLLLRTGELAILAFGTSSTVATATTEVAAPPITEAPSDTRPVTPTTTRRPTTTTAPRPTPTTAPPTTAAPPTTTAPCNPNYAKCLNRSGDYDCVGDSDDPDWSSADQNGPNFVAGPFAVSGTDQYGLDRNGNGIACERAAQT